MGDGAFGGGAGQILTLNPNYDSGSPTVMVLYCRAIGILWWWCRILGDRSMNEGVLRCWRLGNYLMKRTI